MGATWSAICVTSKAALEPGTPEQAVITVDSTITTSSAAARWIRAWIGAALPVLPDLMLDHTSCSTTHGAGQRRRRRAMGTQCVGGIVFLRRLPRARLVGRGQGGGGAGLRHRRGVQLVIARRRLEGAVFDHHPNALHRNALGDRRLLHLERRRGCVGAEPQWQRGLGDQTAVLAGQGQPEPRALPRRAGGLQPTTVQPRVLQRDRQPETGAAGLPLP